MVEAVPLTTKLLMDTGGWKEMKEARLIHSAGRVEEASYQKGILEGLVIDKGNARKVRVTIHSRTNWDNGCNCPLSRRDGAVCAHALAVALQVIDPVAPAAAPPAVAAAQVPTGPPKPKLSSDWPKVTERPDDANAVSAQLFVVLAPQIANAWEKGRLMAGIEIEIEGKNRCLLGAAKAATGKLFLGPRDIALYQTLQAITHEQVPGMMQLGRGDFLQLLDA